MSLDPLLAGLLDQCVRRGASDLHLSAGAPAYARVGGELVALAGDAVAPEAAAEAIASLLAEGQQRILEATGSVDVGFSLPGGERFRGHVFREQRGPALAARRLEDRFRSLAELNLPPVLAGLADLRDGLVLFTGPTGSGKSTSLATLLDRINRERACHILTIEDPIEYLHTGRRSLIRQRELHHDVGSFAEAVRASLREDPDVVLVGEMRDADTMRAAITVAETGHLVFSTLHCGSAVGAIDRLVGAFPAGERESLCQQLSMTLRAVVAQHLLPATDGRGRVPAVELLMVTHAVANLIRSHKSEQIRNAIETGGESGMQTLEQSLAALVAARRISPATARAATGDQRLLDQRLRALGLGPA